MDVSQPSRFKRSVTIGVNLLPPLHTGILVTYFFIRWIGGGKLWFIDALSYVLPWLFVPLIPLFPIALFRRSRTLVVSVSTLSLLFLLTYGHLYWPRRSVRADASVFTVMTYNVYIQNSDADQIAAIVKEHSPDIVGLHELRKSIAETLQSQLSEQYPYLRIEPGCCGVFSRYPILDYQTFQLGEDRAQQATLDLDGRPVDVFNVHLQMPLETTSGSLDLSSTEYVNDLRDANVQDLLSRLEATDTPVIVIGDFNLTDQQSSYAALTHHLRDAHYESGWGMGFTARLLPLGLPTWRIDYIFHSPQLVALRMAFGDYGASDHRPVIAELAFMPE